MKVDLSVKDYINLGIQIIQILWKLRGFKDDVVKIYYAIEEAFYKLSGKKLTSYRKKRIFKDWARAEYKRRTGKAAPPGFAQRELDCVWAEANPGKVPKSPDEMIDQHINEDPGSCNKVDVTYPIRRGKSRAKR